MQQQFVCIELQGDTCIQWQALQQPQSLPLTKEQADTVTLEIMAVMVLVWGWLMVKKTIKVMMK